MTVTLSNVTATGNDQSILFTWQISGSPAAGSYMFRYNVSGNPTVSSVNVSISSITYNESTSSYSYLLTGPINGTIYNASFRVYSSSTPSPLSIIAQSSNFTVTPSAPAPAPEPSVPCFPPGVLIATPSGNKPVETLKTGDLVLTASKRVVPIRMHSYSIESASASNAPFFIPAHALGHKAPAKPLRLSPLHAFQIRPNVWWNAREASRVCSKLTQFGIGEPITYYHVECPDFLGDNLVADGVVVESFAANQLTKAQKHNLYKFSKKLNGFIRKNPTTE
jgi:hypothetical protein